MFDHILVPTDGSERAEMAAEYAREFATNYGATVHVLCVTDSRTVDSVPHADTSTEQTDLAERSRVDFSEADIPVKQVVETDIPYKAILRYAADEGIDLIVMGTRGRTGVERYLLGSVAEKAVRTSPVPVMTVRRPNEAQ